MIVLYICVYIYIFTTHSSFSCLPQSPVLLPPSPWYWLLYIVSSFPLSKIEIIF